MGGKNTKSEVLITPEEIELRKVKALEKIANSLDALTIWFEEINKDDWDKRLQYYLSEFHRFEKNKSGEDNVLNG